MVLQHDDYANRGAECALQLAERIALGPHETWPVRECRAGHSLMLSDFYCDGTTKCSRLDWIFDAQRTLPFGTGLFLDSTFFSSHFWIQSAILRLLRSIINMCELPWNPKSGSRPWVASPPAALTA